MKRETGFFVQTAKEYGLELLVDGVLPPVSENGTGSGLLSEYNQITKSYVEYLHAVAATGTLEEGLVVLWAMEKVSLSLGAFESLAGSSEGSRVPIPAVQ